jgi:hypothetical protein
LLGGGAFHVGRPDQPRSSAHPFAERLSQNQHIMAILSLGPAVQRRRIDRDKLRLLAELMITYPGATVAEYSERLGLSRRTLERWRRHEAFAGVLSELARTRYASVLLPKALRAAERILDNPGSRADSLIIEVLRGSGLLTGQRLDVHHSGVVVTENGDSLREQILARVAEVREQQARALPEAIEVDGDMPAPHMPAPPPTQDADHVDGDAEF